MSKLPYWMTDDYGVPRCDDCGKSLPRDMGEWAQCSDGQFHRECAERIEEENV